VRSGGTIWGTVCLYKPGAARPQSLGNCTKRGQHLQREVGEHQQGLGEVSCCGLCRAKTVRRCFCASANILLAHIFCRRLTFVDANILSSPIFCEQQYFVNANILSMPIFCQHQYLSMPIFSRCQYFVSANILSAPIFLICTYIFLKFDIQRMHSFYIFLIIYHFF
jgi:hypothetical protein